MTDYTDDQIAAEIRGCVDFYDRDRAIARHFLALGRQEKGEPVAFVWEGHDGPGTRSLRWSKPTQWDHAPGGVTPLYAGRRGFNLATSTQEEK